MFYMLFVSFVSVMQIFNPISSFLFFMWACLLFAVTKLLDMLLVKMKPIYYLWANLISYCFLSTALYILCVYAREHVAEWGFFGWVIKGLASAQKMSDFTEYAHSLSYTFAWLQFFMVISDTRDYSKHLFGIVTFSYIKNIWARWLIWTLSLCCGFFFLVVFSMIQHFTVGWIYMIFPLLAVISFCFGFEIPVLGAYLIKARFKWATFKQAFIQNHHL